MTILPLLLQLSYLLFLFLVWLLWLGLQILCWIHVVRVGILFLFPILEEMLSTFYHCVSYKLWVCHIWPFLFWFTFPLYPVCWEFLSWMACELCKCFFCIYWDDHMLFILHFVNVVCHVGWFVGVKPSLHPWNRFHLTMVYDSFAVLLILVCSFVEDFHLVFVHQGYWSLIFFFFFL